MTRLCAVSIIEGKMGERMHTTNQSLKSHSIFPASVLLAYLYSSIMNTLIEEASAAQ